MVTSRGGTEVRRFIAQIPADLETMVLRGAARAAAIVVRDEAKERSISHEVAEAMEIKSRRAPRQIVVKIGVKAGWARSLAIWQEYSTAPHFISVDDSQRQGMSVNRINRLDKEARKNGGSLVIGGKFVGETVFHPGAQAHPFLRVSLDLKEDEALAAAQSYINQRVTRTGIVGADDLVGDGE